MSQVEVARAAGVSDFTVRRLQQGVAGTYRAANLAKVSLALGWTAESIQQILDGGEPTESAAPAEPLLAEIVARLAAMESRLGAVEERLADYPRGGSKRPSGRRG